MPCEKPLLSIIVPVYDVEKYLQKCIDSILAQTLTDFELILVEDGSPDNCPALCDAAAAKDARIRVIHQKNGGLSAARNAGLDVARGEWIGFVDSDDYIAPEMYETLYKAVQSTGADLALCDYAEVDETGALCPPMHISLAEQVFTGRELLKNATDTMIQPAWNKLYRRAIFAQLRYPEGKLNEDLFLIPEVCLQIQKAVVVPKALYYYVQRGGSIMSGNKTLRHFDAAEAAQRRKLRGLLQRRCAYVGGYNSICVALLKQRNRKPAVVAAYVGSQMGVVYHIRCSLKTWTEAYPFIRKFFHVLTI